MKKLDMTMRQLLGDLELKAMLDPDRRERFYRARSRRRAARRRARGISQRGRQIGAAVLSREWTPAELRAKGIPLSPQKRREEAREEIRRMLAARRAS